MNNEIINEIHLGIGNEISLRSFRVDDEGNEIFGTSRDLARFSNHVTDAGLNMIGQHTGEIFAYAQVGSGNTPPSDGDTALQSFVASSPDQGTQTTGIQTSTLPYYGWKRKVWQFGMGQAAGNLSEIGVSPSTSSSGPLYNRALIRDSGGDPTTITILSDEVLEATFENRVYVPQVPDVEETLTLDGNDYLITGRAAGMSGSGQGQWGGISGGGIAAGGAGAANSVSDWIGPVTTPGFNGEGSVTILGSYATNSFYRDFRIALALDQGNISGGVGSVMARTNFATFQYGFTPKLPKTAEFTFRMDVRIHWNRQ